MTEKFKNVNGTWLTSALFVNIVAHEGNMYAIGASDIVKDGITYPSFDKLYMSLNDPSEYLISQELGGWKHWQAICKSSGVRPHIESLRDELAQKLRSQGLQEIIKQAKGVKGYSAARYLADKGWVPNTKIEKVRKTKEQQRMINEFQDDLDRISSVAIN